MKKVLRTEIPRKAIYRLSVYSRCLNRLENNGIHTVSSEVLAKAAGVKSTQLRKDLTYFGQFGTRGLGYEVKQLIEMISDLLGTKSLQPVVIIGIGNLGRALLTYRGFEREGFEIVGAFDVKPSQYLSNDSPINVQAMDLLPKFITDHFIKMAILSLSLIHI